MYIDNISLTASLRNTLGQSLSPIKNFIQNKTALIALIIFGVISTLAVISYHYFKNRNIKINLSADQEKIIQKLKEEIDFYEKQNEIFTQQLQRFQDFMLTQPPLMQAYKDAYKQTKHILLSPPKKHISKTQIQHPIVAEWREVRLRNIHLLKIRTRIFDFLEKNPEFCQLLKDELGAHFIPQGYIQ